MRNAKVEEDSYERWLYRHRLVSPSFHDRAIPLQEPRKIDQSFSHLKCEQTSWLKAVPSQVLRNGVRKYYRGWQKCWQEPSAKPPRKAKKYRSCLHLTRECFAFREEGLWIGTAKRPLGLLRFKAHRDWKEPASVTISEQSDGTWWLSFTCEDAKGKSSRPLVKLTDNSRVIGIDRGVAIPVATSTGRPFDMPEDQKRNLNNRQRRIKGLQQRLARQRKGSRRREKTRRSIARCHRRIQHSRYDFAHKSSRQLADSDTDILSFEALKLKNMTASASGTLTEPGKNVAAKSGLNRGLLNASLGLIARLIEYKARQRGIHVRYEPAAHTSRECAKCGYTDPLNRKTQAEFHCQACGHRANADFNAAEVVAARTKRWLKEEFTVGGNSDPPPRKRVGRRREPSALRARKTA